MMRAAVALCAVLALRWIVVGRWQVVPCAFAGNSSALAAGDPEATAPRWAVDPGDPGPNLPPAGRSLFDSLVAAPAGGPAGYDIPFPIDALVRRIEKRAGCAPGRTACTRQVLIPLGRSLQRTAAAPEFFAHPRVVIAVDREGDPSATSGRLFKDRLYLGYQEAASLIEVISYNEAAARFEFELVKDYRAGGTARVVQANRPVCIACHQNQAPLFSRPQWDETNANPRVAALLAESGRSLYGVPVRVGIEVPNAIDDAIDRANLFAVSQLLWREGCGDRIPEATRCRGAALTAAFQYRLGGERGFDARSSELNEAVASTLARSAASRWPGGLAIPNPDVPNRDPFTFFEGTSGLALTHVPARLEPLVPRPPLATWSADDPQLGRRFVTGLSALVAESDVRAIDAQLARLAAAGRVSPRKYPSTCRVSATERELRFHCRPFGETAGASLDGRLMLDGSAAGEVESVAVAARDPLLHLGVSAARHERQAGTNVLSFVPSDRGRRGRFKEGAAIDGVELRWRENGAGEATVSVIDDFAPLRAAIGALAEAADGDGPLGQGPFDRVRVMAALGRTLGLPQCGTVCEETSALPPAEEDVGPRVPAEVPSLAAVFQNQCSACHQTPEVSPPNFLYGDAERVTAALRACAPRIFVRLGMWHVRPEERKKTPMPPPFASSGGPDDGERGPSPTTIAELQNAAAEMLRAETGNMPVLEQLLAQGYENLRPCLPGPS